ncbi:IclR family transcriptional regulator [Wenjunlia vitaminophila]|uniref:IclR family transcriptional regulator n=1 Tax=Wenjunlia vitaminophila TaxID=76728 RepID=A0A0T6LP02_WENVI|nr:IclR family transcriptional regulator C-terminal domain-containing protein [Wenjunlia vitaminophila]KRV47782.1 IclR family transcriptional regulator [Wenjunlia vitaminophila]
MSLEGGQVAPVHTVQHALRVLDAVDKHEHGVSADQLAREVRMPAGTLNHLLAMLLRENYLRRLTGGGYVLGDTLLRLGGSHRRQHLAERLRASLTALHNEVSAAVYFSRYQDGEITLVDCADSPQAPRVSEWVDFRATGHASAIGKCLLGQLDHEGRREHLSRHRVAPLTSHTITDEEILLTKLDGHPATVPVLDLQEYAVGTVCAAVPVTAGATAGALALSMPVAQAFRLREAAETLNRRAAPLLLSLAI